MLRRMILDVERQLPVAQGRFYQWSQRRFPIDFWDSEGLEEWESDAG